MLTRTELIEKLKNSKLRHIVARTSTLSMPKYKQFYNDAIDLAIKYSNELPDTTELQAENEVLKQTINYLLKQLYVAEYLYEKSIGETNKKTRDEYVSDQVLKYGIEYWTKFVKQQIWEEKK